MIYGICQKIQGDWLEFLESEQNLDFTHIELYSSDVSPESYMFDHSYLTKVKETSSKKNYSLSLHAIQGINLGEKVRRLRNVSRDIVIETLYCGEYIDAKWVTIHLGTAGFSSERIDKKKHRLDLVIETLHEILEVTKNLKINIAIENLPRCPPSFAKTRLGDSKEEFEYIFSHIKSERLKMLFDIGHARILECESNTVNQFIEKVFDRILAFHLHWNDKYEDSHLPLDDSSKIVLLKILQYLLSDRPLLFECYSRQDNLKSAKILRSLQDK
ncbi:sugar phosphate isomerase/epimerase family protein [Paenibacillus periandrae]|uniref:sugar phosphate isomerase/epimerase family protein n=1 Tax=Paenibacillus periandrae TaxID=1761741 RepID=UPI001F09CBAE|nr:TIM barrel protein [Paenibacillus periandrae]